MTTPGLPAARWGRTARWVCRIAPTTSSRGWISRDPIQRYTRWLLAKDLASEAELASIDAETQAAVDASVEFARQGADPNPEAGVLNTHAEGGAAATQFYNRRGLAT